MPDIDQRKQELDEINKELPSFREGSAAWKAMTRRKTELEAELIGTGAIAQGENNIAAGEGATIVQESIIVQADKGARVIIGTEPVKMSNKMRATALGRYLEHVIAHNRYLQLQGIQSDGKPVNIELEHIYITLRTTQQGNLQTEEEWLRAEARTAPGELARRKLEHPSRRETITVTVNQVLEDQNHLVVLGDPGSGKTTLLRYLALLYGRDLAEKTNLVKTKLELDDTGYLPVLLHLRQFSAYLKEHRAQDDGTEGYALLLEYLFRAMSGYRIELPQDFFDNYLQKGKAIILLDGMDEVADPVLRARVARMVEAFTLANPACRFIITSRIVGYTGAARLAGDYITATVRDFSLADVKQFLSHWHRLVAVGQLGLGENADVYADSQTSQLMIAIRNNERIRELAINPLMLTVIALIHRDRVKLPDRRAELYGEAVDVLLGRWDDARGVGALLILDDRPFETGDKRLMLQSLALWMHEHEQKEISEKDLYIFLEKEFEGLIPDSQKRRAAVEIFIRTIEERSGLLTARGEGIFAFSHLTFQEYLAARSIAGRDDYVKYTLRHIHKPWWREVILLEASHLSSESIERVSHLIERIIQSLREPLPYHNLVLAAECLRDAGDNRVLKNVALKISKRMDKALKAPPPITTRIFKKWEISTWVDQRATLIQVLARSGKGYWGSPFGAPEWIKIPAGTFWMGNGSELHEVYLPEFHISKVPITNAQYAIFTQETKYAPPPDWEEFRPTKGRESHPVVNVSWYDAINYCEWLSTKMGKNISLPSEAEWEKACRKDDKREYPWGNWRHYRANTNELGVGHTTPAGIFLEGASPYNVLDLSGNVWEWTRSLIRQPSALENGKISEYHYPYDANDGRENLKANRDSSRIIRGGSFASSAKYAKCSHRDWLPPASKFKYFGFRVVILSNKESQN